MHQPASALLSLGLVLSLALLTGCGTLLHGRHTNINVKSTPSGANVRTGYIKNCESPTLSYSTKSFNSFVQSLAIGFGFILASRLIFSVGVLLILARPIFMRSLKRKAAQKNLHQNPFQKRKRRKTQQSREFQPKTWQFYRL